MTTPHAETSTSTASASRDATTPRIPTHAARNWLAASMRFAPLLAITIFFVFAVRAGIPSNAAIRALMVVALTQVVPGALTWRVVRAGKGWLLEDAVAGLAIGAAIAVAAQTLAGSLQVPALAWVPGLAVTASVLASPGLRQRALQARSTVTPWWWGPTVAATAIPLLIEVQGFYRQVPVSWDSGFRAVPTDVYFHLSLVGQVAHRGPGEVPFVMGEPLSYHWFSHAWVAQIGTAASVPLDQVLFRVAPPLLAVALVLAIAITAVRITDRAWAGPVASLLAVASGDVNLFGGISPFTRGVLVTSGALSLAFASLLLVVLLGLLAMRWRGHHHPLGWVVVLLLATGIAGGKGSALPLVLAGVGLAFGVALLWRWPSRRRIGIDLALLLLTFLGTFLMIFGGSARLVLDPAHAVSEAGISAYLLGTIESPSTPLVLAGIAMVLASVLARASGLLAMSAVPDLRRDPIAHVLLGASVAGALAVVLLAVGGKSQYYFLRNAIPLMAIGSALGLVALWDRLSPHAWRTFATGAITGTTIAVVLDHAFARVTEASTLLVPTTIARSAAAVALLVVGVAVSLRAAPRPNRLPAGVAVASVSLVVLALVPTLSVKLTSSLPPSPSPLPPTERFAFSADQIDAARWLRDHSNVDDIVMTNRHCASPEWVNCDSRRFAITAFTERPVMLEGWAYTRSWALSEAPGGVYKPFWDPELQARNDEFLAAPSAPEAESLYDDGVRWIYIDKTEEWSDELTGFAAPAYETEWAWVLELREPSG